MNAFLNWQSDPLLWDQTPLPATKWVTLNELLEQDKNGTLTMVEKLQQLQKEEPLKNFFGTLIRKRDFVREKKNPTGRKIRILTRMPFLPLKQHSELKERITQRGWLIAEASRDYFYRSAMNDHSISNWKKRIKRYLERESIPLPVIRADPECWEQLSKEIWMQKKLTIKSVKGEQ